MTTRRTVMALGAAGGIGLGLAGSSVTVDRAHARGPADPPELPGTTVEDLGSPMSSLTVVEGAFTTLADGRLAAVAPTQGENSELNVSTVDDPATQIGRYPMTGAGGGPTITVTEDGLVYVGTYNQGHLYCWDPATEQMSDLGNPTGQAEFLYGLTAAPDGTVYGGTYPDAKLWSHHPENGFTDLGRVSDDADITYVKAAVYDPEHHALYAGTQPKPHLHRLDLDSGEVTEIVGAEPFVGTAISDLDLDQGVLLVTNDRRLRVFDTATGDEIDVVDAETGEVTREYSCTGRGTSQARDGRIWFSTAGPDGTVLGSYEIATRTASRTEHTTYYGSLVGYHWTSEDDHDVLYGFAGNYLAGAFRYDLQADESQRYTFALSPAPSPLGNIVASPDGSQVLINAFLNGNGVRRDVATGEITDIARLGQVEDWTWAEQDDESVVYAGIYPNGTLLAYRPDQDEDEANPYRYVELKGEPHPQIRPQDVQVNDGVLWATSEPDYGLRGGAITTVDLASGEVVVTQDVVSDHTICALTFHEDRVFAGSSRNGGTGTSPVDGSAVLVEFDPTERTVVRTLTPLEGAASVNALMIHDGRLVGLADTTVFEVDLDDFELTRTFALPDLSGTAAPGGGDIALHPSGHLAVHCQSTAFLVDPLSFERTSRVLDRCTRLVVSSDRSLWTLWRPDGVSDPQHHVRITLDSEAEPDVRRQVHVGESTTGVANRFVATDRTLADVVADADNAELGRLVAAGRITAKERAELARALRNG